jgi:cytochrome c peroxidase
MLLVVLAVGALVTCAPAAEEPAKEPAPPAFVPGPPADFERPVIPADNPQTPEKVALGKQLYFDTRLSADGTRSCYSCHLVENGLTDGKPVAEGALGRVLTRSSPTLWNIAYHTQFYWDGRSGSLEAQARAAWTGGNMGADADAVVAELNGIPGYAEQFEAVFGGPATPDTVVQAIAAFEREAFYCGDTTYDDWRRGDASAISESAMRGAELFTAGAGCATCHSGVLFTDMKYHNVGIGMDAEEPDLGRGRVTEDDACSTTEDEACQGAFKTPTLRDISKSAPYFHDGSVATLEEAVRLMASGGLANPYLDTDELMDRALSEEQIADLVAFLHTLDCNSGARIFDPPALP